MIGEIVAAVIKGLIESGPAIVKLLQGGDTDGAKRKAREATDRAIGRAAARLARDKRKAAKK